MNKGTAVEWVVTLGVFAISATILFLAGYEDRGVVGAVSFATAAVCYAGTVRWEKRKRKGR